MVVDAVRTYLDAASGLTELSRKQAVAAAKILLRANGSTTAAAVDNESLPPRVGQSIQTLAGELIETSRANREALAGLVRSEVERQLEGMDVVSRAEHERLVRRVAELERRLAARQAVEYSSAETGAPSPARSAASEASGDQSAGPAEEEAAAEAPRPREGNASSDDATAAESGEAVGAAATKPVARNKPRTPAKTTRTRSSAKRTTKSRGGTKK